MPLISASRRTAFLLLLAASLWAQEKPLDLHGALAAADDGNLELRAARQQRAIALAGLTIARQRPNPTLSFSASRDAPHESAQWEQPIELGGKRGRRIDIAREEQKSTGLEIEILSRQIRHRTREAFYRVLLARAQTGQAKGALDLASRLKEAVQQRFDLGDVAQLEVIQADVEVARAQADFDSASQSERSADTQFAALIHGPLDRPTNLEGRMEDLPIAPAVTELDGRAARTNPDVQRALQELNLEQRRLGLAKAQRVPDLNLQLGADLNSPPDFNVGPRGQIAFVLPLFYHGQGEVAQSSARLEFFRLSLQAQELNTKAQVGAAYFDYLAKRSLAEQYSEKIVPETVRLEEMSEDSYRSGKSNLLTVIDAQRKLNEVRRNYLDSQFAVQSAFANLEEVVGTPLD